MGPGALGLHPGQRGAARWCITSYLLRGYRRADLTVVYPLARGSGPWLSSLVAIGLLGERLTPLGAAASAAWWEACF